MADKPVIGGYIWNGQVADGLAALKHARHELQRLQQVIGRDPGGHVAATLFELGNVQDILWQLQQIGNEAKR